MSQHIHDMLKPVRLVVLDVDGVLTNGQLYFSAEGETLKAFNTLDGHGIKMLQKSGVEVAIISGRESPALAKRAANLGIELLYTNREDKHSALTEMLSATGYTAEQTAMMGDDWPDLLAMYMAGVAATVPNASEAVLEYADWCATYQGGEGAVREFCELIMKAQGTYDAMLKPYLSPEPSEQS